MCSGGYARAACSSLPVALLVRRVLFSAVRINYLEEMMAGVGGRDNGKDSAVAWSWAATPVALSSRWRVRHTTNPTNQPCELDTRYIPPLYLWLEQLFSCPKIHYWFDVFGRQLVHGPLSLAASSRRPIAFSLAGRTLSDQHVDYMLHLTP